MTIVKVVYETWMGDIEEMDVTSSNCVSLESSKPDCQLVNIAINYVRSIKKAYFRLLKVEIIAR